MSANIVCCVCGARPYPPPGFREDFDLMKLSATGRPAAAEGDEGRWYCSSHFERDRRGTYRVAKIIDGQIGGRSNEKLRSP